MLVTVLLFARLRELAAASQLQMDLTPGATVQDAWDAVAARHKDLQPYAGTVSYAVNAEYSQRTAALKEGDEVAFLPPVSGG